ncbi:SDR family oxidoreductase [Kitasatospora sp. NPDC002227]|uniref:SDR family oxidoreductase n=1 Tax=Kitasatospora sp. NPDC002227 TaxID=3154773 RepID=UPI0033196444
MARYVITGATGGIGGATARQLHAQGHQVVLLGSDRARLDAATAALPGSEGLLLDLRDPAALAGGAAPLTAGGGAVDGLVHSAGLALLGSIADTAPETWTTQFTVNVVAAAELTRALLPALRAARGHVVFVNSGQGLRTNPGWGAYSAAKHAARALAEALREEERPHGLRVTSVYPGRTATGMQQSIRAQEGGAYLSEQYSSPESVAGAVVGALLSPGDMEITDITVRPGG